MQLPVSHHAPNLGHFQRPSMHVVETANHTRALKSVMLHHDTKGVAPKHVQTFQMQLNPAACRPDAVHGQTGLLQGHGPLKASPVWGGLPPLETSKDAIDVSIRQNGPPNLAMLEPRHVHAPSRSCAPFARFRVPVPQIRATPDTSPVGMQVQTPCAAFGPSR